MKLSSIGTLPFFVCVTLSLIWLLFLSKFFAILRKISWAKHDKELKLIQNDYGNAYKLIWNLQADWTLHKHFSSQILRISI